MREYRLAQLNIASMKAPLESPVMADFVGNLERINALAECSPGFVWRLKDEEGDATAVRAFGDNVLVNMSVWEDVASLAQYAFKSAHVEIMRRRNEWFERLDRAYMVLWWVDHDHIPTLAEAAERLAYLQKSGPTAHAFVFKNAFPAPDGQGLAGPAEETRDFACPGT